MIGCGYYFNGFDSISDRSWEFAAGSDSCEIYPRFECGRDKQSYQDSLYTPEFYISDGGHYKTYSIEAIQKTIFDSIIIQYSLNDSLVTRSYNEHEYKFHDEKFKRVSYPKQMIPTFVDTLWISLYIKAPYNDNYLPLSHTWSMLRKQYKGYTMFTD